MSQSISPTEPYPQQPHQGDVQGYPQQQHGGSPQLRRYEFTAEERRAMAECNRESFYYRSLPFSVVGVIAVKYFQNLGYLKPAPVYGMSLKYTAAVALGYFLGKLSYLGACKQKLLNLPNSKLAEYLRSTEHGRRGQFGVLQEMVALPEISTSSGSGGDQGYAPIREGSDMYTNPDFAVSGQDAQSGVAQLPPKQSTNYEELRRRNREEYLRQQFAGSGQSSAGQQQQQVQAGIRQPATSSSGQQQKSRFNYGDSQQQTTTKYGDTDFK